MIIKIRNKYYTNKFDGKTKTKIPSDIYKQNRADYYVEKKDDLIIGESLFYTSQRVYMENGTFSRRIYDIYFYSRQK